MPIDPQLSSVDLMLQTIPIVLCVISMIMSLLVYIRTKKSKADEIKIIYTKKNILRLLEGCACVNALYLFLSINAVSDGSFISFGGINYLWILYASFSITLGMLVVLHFFFSKVNNRKFMEKEQITCPVAEHEEPLLSQVKELDFKKYR